MRLGLEDERIHVLILGYWHTIVTPPTVFATLLAEILEEMLLDRDSRDVLGAKYKWARGAGLL